MNLEYRIESLSELGNALKASLSRDSDTVKEAVARNPWFTPESVMQSVEAITERYLDRTCLEQWIEKENVRDGSTNKTVGIVMAGNIPMVGFHDLLSVLVTGHRAQVKLSERDEVLMQFLNETLVTVDPSWQDYIETSERLRGFDAVIATGSDSTSRYFEKYFSSYPHIIRKNRHGVAVIYKDNNKESVLGLGDDIFSYFGLGCRNVSKLYLEEGVGLDFIFELLEPYRELIHHNKYKNNYDYNNALYLLSKDEFYSNDFVLLKRDKNISSRIASVHFEYFTSAEHLKLELANKADEIQCIISSRKLPGLKTYPFGYAQKPRLTDYADGVNTVQFLKSLDEDS